LQNRARKGKWGINITVLDGLIQPEAAEYVGGAGRLSVMPSLLENSPFTVLECLAQNIPFIVSDVGGIPELIHPSDIANVTFKPQPVPLAKRLDEVLSHGMALPRARSKPRKTWKEHLDFYRILEEKRVKRHAATSRIVTQFPRYRNPLVSVCIVHHNRGVLLLKTIDAILAQDYWPFEIVMVDDGSTDPEALSVLKQTVQFFNQTQMVKFRYISTPNRFPGAARNTAAHAANGKFLVFSDDDDIPKPNWISSLVRVAHNTHADVVTCMADFFHGDWSPPPNLKPDARWLSLGAAADLGMYHNVFGSSQALVRKKSFFKIGGFSEEGHSTFEDWEFFATAVLKGFHLESIPEALSWYRQKRATKEKSLMSSTNSYNNKLRALRPYQRVMPPELRNAVLFGWSRAAATKSKKNSPLR